MNLTFIDRPNLISDVPECLVCIHERLFCLWEVFPCFGLRQGEDTGSLQLWHLRWGRPMLKHFFGLLYKTNSKLMQGLVNVRPSFYFNLPELTRVENCASLLFSYLFLIVFMSLSTNGQDINLAREEQLIFV